MAEPSVVVIGGGQAGLSVSRELSRAGVDHVVLEKGRVAQTWRGRWDSFTLVTPNWTLSLPGQPYEGPDSEGHVSRDEIVAYIERFAAGFSAPVETGVEVTRLAPAPDGGFLLQTTRGELRAREVVVSTGAYQRPHRPPTTGTPPPGLLLIDAEDYDRPSSLPPGPVLVVGSGQTGCQLADDLHRAGREVFLACGRAPWVPRRLGDLDSVTWIARTPWYETQLAELPSPAARLAANVQTSGRDGGIDLHYRVLQRIGVHLTGRLTGFEGQKAILADDLAASVAWGDERWAQNVEFLRKHLPVNGYAVPEFPEVPPFESGDPPTELDLTGFAAVLFTSGFRPDYRRWVDLPAFDEMGFPLAPDGVCPAVPGLYFCGVHFLRKRKSSLLFGVGEDAAVVAAALTRRLETAAL